MSKKCPKCGRNYGELSNYCTMCGLGLEEVKSMKYDTKQQVLLRMYIEYQKDIPDMKSINNTEMNMDIDVFNNALKKLNTEGYIKGLYIMSADNEEFYSVRCDEIEMTRDGIDYVENKFGIEKELTAVDKLKYVTRKCGVFGFSALKIIADAAVRSLM